MRMASRPSGCSLSRNLIFHQITNLTTEDTEGTETKPFLPISEVGGRIRQKAKEPQSTAVLSVSSEVIFSAPSEFLARRWRRRHRSDRLRDAFPSRKGTAPGSACDSAP